MTRRQWRRARRHARKMFGCSWKNLAFTRSPTGKGEIVTQKRVDCTWHPDVPRLDTGGGTIGRDCVRVYAYRKAEDARHDRGCDLRKD